MLDASYGLPLEDSSVYFTLNFIKKKLPFSCHFGILHFNFMEKLKFIFVVTFWTEWHNKTCGKQDMSDVHIYLKARELFLFSNQNFLEISFYLYLSAKLWLSSQNIYHKCKSQYYLIKMHFPLQLTTRNLKTLILSLHCRSIKA